MKKITTFLLACLTIATILSFTSCATKREKDALRTAQRFIDTFAISEQKIMEDLENLGYSYEEIEYAMDKCDVDWYDEAVEAAENLLESSTNLTEDQIIAWLELAGFTSSEAEYAAEEVLE
ncbi:MAG: Ltp family lipoprotein [Clostridia bacterium]|nr:Ltp family lipoprotein [Clostridia bacterium]